MRARDLAVVVFAKAVISGLVLSAGFRAVSDDDFSRVVLAQAWAHAPRLDPTGSSWLPVPFWLNGVLFRMFAPTLDVARANAFAAGLFSAAVVYVAALWITGDRRSALPGALLAAAFSWSAWLGVATVPELPTAALTLLAVASLVTPPAGPAPPAARALWGGLALALATLSRYEAWPIAILFAAMALLSACRLGQSRVAQAQLLGAASIALAGPIAWLAWNRIAHGDALHFLARVAAYRHALAPREDGTIVRLFAYPAAMMREEPELFLSPIALAGVVVCARRAARCGAPVAAVSAAEAPVEGALPGIAALPLHRRALHPYAVVCALAAFQIAMLALALVRDGAPTHHPERATLVALLLLALVVGDLFARLLRAGTPRERLTLFAAGLAVLLLGLVSRPHLRREHFNPRSDEVAIGRIAAELVAPGARILVEVADYGHLAILASLGRPEGVVPDRSIDPRDPPVRSSFEDPAALERRATEAGALYLVARDAPAVTRFAGAPLVTRGAWGLWAVAAAPPAPRATRGEDSQAGPGRALANPPEPR